MKWWRKEMNLKRRNGGFGRLKMMKTSRLKPFIIEGSINEIIWVLPMMVPCWTRSLHLPTNRIHPSSFQPLEFWCLLVSLLGSPFDSDYNISLCMLLSWKSWTVGKGKERSVNAGENQKMVVVEIIVGLFLLLLEGRRSFWNERKEIE